MNLTDLLLLTDENIDLSVVDFLRQKGFDVWDVKEMNWRGRLDCIPPFILVVEDKITHIKIRLRNSI